MSPNPLRVARGTTSSITSRTLKPGELAQSTETELIHVGDGETAGGRTLAFRDELVDFLIDDYDNDLQDAIDAAYAYGGGVVIVDRNINLPATAILKDYVKILVMAGVTITWTGGSAPMFSSASDNVLLHAGIDGYGATLAMGASATKAIEVYGAWHCAFVGFEITGTLVTSIAIDLRGDASGGANQVGGRHCAYNQFADILHAGVCGTFLRLYGTDSNSGFITLNTFTNLGAESCQVRGIEFYGWCDHNEFTGITRVALYANNAVGVEFNTMAPTQNRGVYANNFNNLAIDTFGTYTGRVGVKINWAKNIVMQYLYQSPVAEGGTLVTTSDTGAYWILHFVEAESVFRLLTNAAEIPANAVKELAGRNVILNGCARVWQQGTSFTSASTPANNDDTYLADQVILLSDGNDIIDFSQETTVVPTGAYASFKLDVETANKKFGLLFPVEARDAARLIGGNMVASFEARKGGSNATAETLRAAIISWQGTADAITSDVVSAWEAAGTNPTLAANWTYETTPQNLTLTTSFQKFDEDDGLAGAIDTASTKQFAVFIWCDDADATVADLIYISKVQLEAGLVATEFEHRPLGEETWKCRRYFERAGIGFTGEWLSSSTVSLAGRWASQKRTSPVVSLNTGAPLIAEVGVANRTGSSSTISASGTAFTDGFVSYVLDGFSSATAGKMAMVASNCLDFDARL